MNTQTAGVVHTVSPNATRRHPWEHWVEPGDKPKVRYFGVQVEVIQSFEHWTLVRRPDGLSCIVETADLSEVRHERMPRLWL